MSIIQIYNTFYTRKNQITCKTFDLIMMLRSILTFILHWILHYEQDDTLLTLQAFKNMVSQDKKVKTLYPNHFLIDIEHLNLLEYLIHDDEKDHYPLSTQHCKDRVMSCFWTGTLPDLMIKGDDMIDTMNLTSTRYEVELHYKHCLFILNCEKQDKKENKTGYRLSVINVNQVQFTYIVKKKWCTFCSFSDKYDGNDANMKELFGYVMPWMWNRIISFESAQKYLSEGKDRDGI